MNPDSFNNLLHLLLEADQRLEKTKKEKRDEYYRKNRAKINAQRRAKRAAKKAAAEALKKKESDRKQILLTFEEEGCHCMMLDMPPCSWCESQ